MFLPPSFNSHQQVCGNGQFMLSAQRQHGPYRVHHLYSDAPSPSLNPSTLTNKSAAIEQFMLTAADLSRLPGPCSAGPPCRLLCKAASTGDCFCKTAFAGFRFCKTFLQKLQYEKYEKYEKYENYEKPANAAAPAAIRGGQRWAIGSQLINVEQARREFRA